MTTINKVELVPLFHYLSSKVASTYKWTAIFCEDYVTAFERQAYNARLEAFEQETEAKLGKRLTPELLSDYYLERLKAHGIVEPAQAKTCTLVLLRCRKQEHLVNVWSKQDFYREISVLVEKRVSEDVKEAVRVEEPGMRWAEEEPEEFDYFEYATAAEYVRRMRHEHLELDRLAKLNALQQVIAA